METLEDLVSYQKELDQEEEVLTKIILQINEQINRLQVEHMELQSVAFQSGNMEQDTKLKIEPLVDRTSEQLILNVPSNIKDVVEEEMEEEEEEEDDDNYEKKNT